MEQQGYLSASALSDYSDPWRERLKAHGIQFVHGFRDTGHSGAVYVVNDVVGGWGWVRVTADQWISGFLESELGLKKLDKLARAVADERHLAILIHPDTDAGHGIRYDPGDPGRSNLDLWHREITVRGKGGKIRTVKIGYDAARSLDRYIRVRARHAQAYRPQLWLGTGSRGPMTASGIYQVIARRGRECGVEVFPHRFRHHFSHTWVYRGGAEGDLMELNGWSSPQMLRRHGASARSAEPAAATTASWTTRHNPSRFRQLHCLPAHRASLRRS